MTVRRIRIMYPLMEFGMYMFSGQELFMQISKEMDSPLKNGGAEAGS
jgi:hypothetical protein